jgi:hypothetical protein
MILTSFDAEFNSESSTTFLEPAQILKRIAPRNIESGANLYSILLKSASQKIFPPVKV